MSNHTKEQFEEWYCQNCGYLDGSRVTYHETCDECHIPVVLHKGYSQERYDACVTALAGIEDVEGFIEKVKSAVIFAFQQGYESGHHDTVESQYSSPEDSAEDWLVESLLESPRDEALALFPPTGEKDAK